MSALLFDKVSATMKEVGLEEAFLEMDQEKLLDFMKEIEKTKADMIKKRYRKNQSRLVAGLTELLVSEAQKEHLISFMKGEIE